MDWAWALLAIVVIFWLFDRHVTKQFWQKAVLEAQADGRGLLADYVPPAAPL